MNNPKHKSFCCVYKFKPPQLECWIWPECQKLASRWFLVSCRYVTLLRHGSVKQSLNTALKQCSKTFWILLTLASKHCLLLAASRLTTQQTKMPFMFFKERKKPYKRSTSGFRETASEFPFNCGLSQTSLLFCCAINEKNWKDNAIMLLVQWKDSDFLVCWL